MIIKNTSNFSINFYNFDKLRIDLKKISQIAKISLIISFSSGEKFFIFKTSIILFIMSKKTSKSSSKILKKTKISYDNHITWFNALNFWFIQKKIKWVYQINDVNILARIAKKSSDEMKITNVTLMTLLMSQVNENDLTMITNMKKTHEIVFEFKKKYENKRSSKLKSKITKFYNYTLKNNEFIEQVYIKLRNLTRKIIFNDSNFKTIIDDKAIYTRLFKFLFFEYIIIIDV